MSNKLIDMFDDEKMEYPYSIQFDSSEHYNDFLGAIEKAVEKGKTTKIDGVTSIKKNLKIGDSEFPIDIINGLSSLIVFPDNELEKNVETDVGIKKLYFRGINSGDLQILESVRGTGAKYTIVFNTKEKTVKSDIFPEYSSAKSLDELIDYYNVIYYFNRNLLQSENNDEVSEFITNILSNIIYFQRLKKISELLRIEIKPCQINDINDSDLYIERLYFGLIEGKLIKCDQKVTSIDGAQISSDKFIENRPLVCSFPKVESVNILGTQCEIYVVNVAFNLIFDKDTIEDDGTKKIFFKDDESKPMFIVKKFFLEKDQALIEMDNSLDNIDSYYKAKSLIEYIKEAHDEIENKK